MAESTDQMREKRTMPMSLSESTKAKDTSRTRDVMFSAQYYLGNRRALLVLAIVASIAGLALNWNWLVAISLAPILLGTLPCLVMCAFGVCMMSSSARKQSTLSRIATGQGSSSVFPAVGTSLNAAGRCAEPAGDPNSSDCDRNSQCKTAGQ